MTLLFDVPVQTAAERAQNGGDRENNRLDREHGEFYQRVRKGYLALAAAEPERFRVIDASGSREETSNRAIAAVAGWLETQGQRDVGSETTQ